VSNEPPSRQEEFMTTHRVLGIGLALLVAAGCSVAPADDVVQGEDRIIGGQKDNGDPSIVAVLALQPGTTNASICTGSVIDSRVILTAAHCVHPGVLGYKPEVRVLTKSSLTGAAAADFLAVKSVAWHPFFIGTTVFASRNDIAVVVLDQPTSLAPLKINRDKLEGTDGATIRVVGYGTTKDGDGTTAGTKHTADVKLSAIEKDHFLAFAPGITQCHGDSGGPALLKKGKEEVIIGVGWRTKRDDGLCSEGVLDTRVDAFLGWIDGEVKKAAGGNKPGGNPGGASACPSASSLSASVTSENGSCTPRAAKNASGACSSSDDCAVTCCACAGGGAFGAAICADGKCLDAKAACACGAERAPQACY
jgi:secreted trypsin-like serine protease